MNTKESKKSYWEEHSEEIMDKSKKFFDAIDRLHQSVCGNGEVNGASEWEEEINEEELDKLADTETFKKSEEFDNCLDVILSLLDGENQLKIIFKKCLIWAFKVGYRKAMNKKNNKS